jgi:outer membrane receptor protein involved in Fe transport
VLRGPQGTLYGADSMGGLLKFVTVDPSTDAFSARVEAGLSGVYNGSDAGYQLRAAANIPITDDLALRVSGYGRQDPGYVNNVLTHENGVNETRVEGGRFAAMWTPLSNFTAKFSAILQTLNADGLSDVTVLPGLKPWQQNYVPGQFHEAGSVQAYSLTLNYDWNDIQLTSLTGYNVNYAREPFDFTSLLGGVTKNGVPGLIVGFGTPGTPSFVHNNINKITQELRATSTFNLFGMPVDWLLGGFYTHEHTHSTDSIFAADPSGNILAQQWFDTHLVRLDEKAVFGNLTLHFTDKLDLQLGARESFLHILETETGFGPFDFILYGAPSPHTVPPGDTNADVFTYLVTPRYFIDDEQMVYVRLASGYRPGGSNAAGGAPPSFKPDQTRNYELGFKGNYFDGGLTANVSLYYIDWKDIQIQLITPHGFTYESNGGGAKSEGVELELDAHPAPGLTLTASGSYDDAVLTQDLPANSTAIGLKGERLTDTPKYAAFVGAEQHFPLGDALDGYVGADLSFVGNRIGPFNATPNRQVFPSYTKLDLRAGIETGSWLVNVYANNAGNSRGVLQGGIGQFIPYAFTYQQPRTIGIYVTKTF